MTSCGSTPLASATWAMVWPSRSVARSSSASMPMASWPSGSPPPDGVAVCLALELAVHQVGRTVGQGRLRSSAVA